MDGVSKGMEVKYIGIYNVHVHNLWDSISTCTCNWLQTYTIPLHIMMITQYMYMYMYYTYMCGSNVASTSSKAFSKCSHHNVHISRIDSQILCNTSTCRTHCTHTVCFIKIQVSLYIMREKERERITWFATYMRTTFIHYHRDNS